MIFLLDWAVYKNGENNGWMNGYNEGHNSCKDNYSKGLDDGEKIWRRKK